MLAMNFDLTILKSAILFLKYSKCHLHQRTKQTRYGKLKKHPIMNKKASDLAAKKLPADLLLTQTTS